MIECPEQLPQAVALGGGPGAEPPTENRSTLQTPSGHPQYKFFGQVRLSRQSLRDHICGRFLIRGKGRDILPSPPIITIHIDASDVGYGGTLRYDTTTGSPNFSGASCFWTAHNHESSITLKELRAARLLVGRRSFSVFVSGPQVQKLLIHEYNSTKVQILYAMVLARVPLMASDEIPGRY